jgi:hypothetical protein
MVYYIEFSLPYTQYLKEDYSKGDFAMEEVLIQQVLDLGLQYPFQEMS